jgi:hypothetical protein
MTSSSSIIFSLLILVTGGLYSLTAILTHGVSVYGPNSFTGISRFQSISSRLSTLTFINSLQSVNPTHRRHICVNCVDKRQISMTKYLDSIKRISVSVTNNTNTVPLTYDKWRSSVFYMTPLSSSELQQITRQSFGSLSSEYFDTLMSSMNQSSQDNIINLFILSSILDIIFGSLIVPVLDIPSSIKNILGLMSLSYPFLAAIVGYSSPQTLNRLQVALMRFMSRSSDMDLKKERERIAYHEAGAVKLSILFAMSICHTIE